MKIRKKLIEVALPLEAINKAAAREKSIRHGHPSTLHLWWARRPLAAARAVIFSQMVDDPSACPELFPTEKAQEKERKRLFKIIEDLVQWENTNNEEVLEQARAEIWASWRRACADNADHPKAKELFNRQKLPAFHDPFAGGGALPLEAQRLGLEAYASDLNPVAVLINKAMIEIPPKFAGCRPVNPAAKKEEGGIPRDWKGAQGLANDVRYYGKWMRDEAEKRIGHLYPKVKITAEMTNERSDLKQYIGKELTVIAWIWARTVKSPNPAYADVEVPLASTFMLSTKEGKEAYVEPIIENGGYRFEVRVGKPRDPTRAAPGTTAGKRSAFLCLMSGTPVEYDYIRTEGKAGRMGSRLMAAVAEGDRGRVYLSPLDAMQQVAATARPTWRPDIALPVNPRDFKTPNYGLNTFADLFTPRQLVALTTFSDLIAEAQERVRADAVAAGMKDDGKGIEEGGVGARAYAEAVSTFLAFVCNKCADYWSSICSWHNSKELIRNTFGRQAIPIVWDYVECNPFCDSSGNFHSMLDWAWKAIEVLPAAVQSKVSQADAVQQTYSAGKVISTDPPYYDNIGYADLSDFFYVWLRRSLKGAFADLFDTVAVPKAEELVATPYRHGSRATAEAFFMRGMGAAMSQIARQAHPSCPVTIYYAFKQAESDDATGTASTGWETFLQAIINAGLAIRGTWPMRTELKNRMIGSGTNALASSVVLVCSVRGSSPKQVTRREFSGALKDELPAALLHLQHSNIAPVDLAQAAIGPGMAIFTRYSQVLDASGTPLTVRDALALINQVLDEVLASQEGDFDSDSRWAIAWFEQYGFDEGEYGVAETLSKAKNTSVAGMVAAEIVQSTRGKVRLLPAEELSSKWDPTTDSRLTVWEVVHHLVRILGSEGEAGAAGLVAKLGSKAEVARELAYRLYTICERKKRAKEALAYNALVQSWPEIQRLAREVQPPQKAQPDLFDQPRG